MELQTIKREALQFRQSFLRNCIAATEAQLNDQLDILADVGGYTADELHAQGVAIRAVESIAEMLYPGFGKRRA